MNGTKPISEMLAGQDFMNHSKVIRVMLCAALWVGTLCQHPAYGNTDTTHVEVEGIAQVSEDLSSARDEAIRDAKRLALSSGASVEVHQRLTYLNGMLRESAIQMATDAYIKDLQIVEEGRRGDVYRVRISAKITPADGEQVLHQLDVLRSLAGNPRMKIDVRQVAPSISLEFEQVSAGDAVRGMFESDCFGGAFHCIESSQVRSGGYQTSHDPHGTEFSLELLWSASDEGPPPFASESTSLRVVTLDLLARVASSDGSRVIVSSHRVTHGLGVGVRGGLGNALQKSYKQIGSDLMPQILEELIHRTQGFSLIELTFYPVPTFGVVEEIHHALTGIRGVDDVQIRRLVNGTCEMSLQTSLGDGIWAAKSLDGLKGTDWELSVESATIERVDVTVAK